MAAEPSLASPPGGPPESLARGLGRPAWSRWPVPCQSGEVPNPAGVELPLFGGAGHNPLLESEAGQVCPPARAGLVTDAVQVGVDGTDAELEVRSGVDHLDESLAEDRMVLDDYRPIISAPQRHPCPPGLGEDRLAAAQYRQDPGRVGAGSTCARAPVRCRWLRLLMLSSTSPPPASARGGTRRGPRGSVRTGEVEQVGVVQQP
jgi:hypothetical protein